MLREGSHVFALLVVLLEHVTQPKKKSRQGSLESKEELALRQSSPKSWTVAYIPTPEAWEETGGGPGYPGHRDC